MRTLLACEKLVEDFFCGRWLCLFSLSPISGDYIPKVWLQTIESVCDTTIIIWTTCEVAKIYIEALGCGLRSTRHFALPLIETQWSPCANLVTFWIITLTWLAK